MSDGIDSARARRSPAGASAARSTTKSVKSAEPSWAAQALQALDVPAAVLDLDSGNVVWAALSFNKAVGATETLVSELCERLVGLKEAIAESAEAAQQTVLLKVTGRSLEATLTRMDDHRLVLRVLDRMGEAQAIQRHLEDREQLLFTSRMLSIGEMATTLAHEINQPIGAAANLLRGVQMRMERQQAAAGDAAANAPVMQALQRAVDQVMFASKVVARIREYTHLHTPQRKPVEVREVVRACAGLLDWETERESVRVSFDFPVEALWIEADELMLQQVLVNLMRNAIDAMRGNPPNLRRLGLAVRADGPQIEIVVRDSGSGISEQAEQTLFTPFVSTKPTGTGIGLNICRSFIELHRGRLWFSRNSDRGISFHASLPKAQAPSAAPAAITSKEAS